MTSGDYNAAPPTPTPAPQATSSGQTSRAPSAATERTDTRSMRSDMPPPAEPASRRDRAGRLRNPGSRPPTQGQTAQQDPESLFVPDPEEARRLEEEEEEAWAPLDYEKEETLGWDASADHDASVFPTFRDSGSESMSRSNTMDSNEVIEPTQRVSQVKEFGLW